jgi:hypothetical protein
VPQHAVGDPGGGDGGQGGSGHVIILPSANLPLCGDCQA